MTSAENFSGAEDISGSLARIDGMVARARSELAAGAVIDLAPLEERIRGLCAGIQDLPGEAAAPLAKRLTSLLADLEQLHGQIVEGRDALASELGDLGKRRSAVTAYGKGA